MLLNGKLVQEVSRTGVPATIAGYTLSVEYLVRNTTGADWDGCYVMLSRAAADKLAAELNQAQPWKVAALPAAPPAAPIRAIAGRPRRGRATKKTVPMEVEIVDAEVVA